MKGIDKEIKALPYLLLMLFVMSGIAIAQDTAQKGYKTDPIQDLALIYQGGAHRLDWIESQFRPFVVHEFTDGTKDWLFDGFLFLEFTTGKGRTFAMGFAETSARKDDWDYLLNRLFEQGKSLSALDQCIQNVKKEIGEPAYKHQVVLGIPMAHEKQTDWGSLNGQVMDFTNTQDQLTVIQWYLQELQKRFENGNYRNLDLAGFYWVEEDTIYSKDIIVPVSKYIHTQGQKFYWIPYWKARGYEKWEELGFDIAYLQPNHFFTDTIPDSRLQEACEIASNLNMALEVEFDKNALYTAPNSTYQRLVSYIDYFEKEEVFKKSAIAYYTGTDGFLKMSKSKHPKDRALMDRLGKLILNRKALKIE